MCGTWGAIGCFDLLARAPGDGRGAAPVVAGGWKVRALNAAEAVWFWIH